MPGVVEADTPEGSGRTPELPEIVRVMSDAWVSEANSDDFGSFGTARKQRLCDFSVDRSLPLPLLPAIW